MFHWRNCRNGFRNCHIKEYGTYASLDRKMLMLSLNEITKIEAGSEYEQNLFELFNKQIRHKIDFSK